MLFSVVIPVRNERAQLEACLEALLSQDYRGDLEVIVVDGHSTDGTPELLSRYPVRVIPDGGVGVGEARNRGIRAAEGDVVAFIDGDCLPDRGWLSALARRFRAEPGIAGVGGALRVGPEEWWLAAFEDWNAQGFYRGFITSNVAYRRDVLLEAGGFDETLHCGEDWDLYWRIVGRGHRVVYDPAVVVTHVPVENQALGRYLRKQWWYAKSDVRCFARHLERMRSGTARSREADRSFLRVSHQAAVEAGCVTGLLAGALARSPVVAGAALLGLVGWAARRTGRAIWDGLPARDLPRHLATSVVKSAARGAGSLAGLATGVRDLLDGSSRAPSLPALQPPMLLEGERRSSVWESEKPSRQ
ncbi:MAG TPA: glycosyltransferase [Candidatus Thermoplasmatota archaeon]|nr:glycosyltransferase [Candidatus Thermoplasmatota archaeon]